MVKCYTKNRKDGSKYITCNKDIKGNKPAPKKPAPKKPAPPPVDTNLFLEVSKVLTEVAKRKADEKYKKYTIFELKRGAKNWAKVNKVRIQGINSISRNGLITLYTKQKVSMDFLKYNITKGPQYYSTMSGKKRNINTPDFYIDKDKSF